MLKIALDIVAVQWIAAGPAFCSAPATGVHLPVLGYTVLLPTRLSLALMLGSYAGIRLQTSNEEGYLLRTYGEAYRDYARRVGRFLPAIGRLE